MRSIKTTLILLLFSLLLYGCDDGIETHRYKITDLSTGKTYIAADNNIPHGDPGDRYINYHVGAGVTFTTEDGSVVEIDNSYSITPIN